MESCGETLLLWSQTGWAEGLWRGSSHLSATRSFPCFRKASLINNPWKTARCLDITPIPEERKEYEVGKWKAAVTPARTHKYCCNTNGWELEGALQPSCISQTAVEFLREPFNLQRQFTGLLLPGPQPPSSHNLPWNLALDVSIHLWAPGVDGSAGVQIRGRGPLHPVSTQGPPCPPSLFSFIYLLVTLGWGISMWSG